MRIIKWGATVLAVGTLLTVVGVSSSTAKTEATCTVAGVRTVCYPLDRNSVASAQVVDNSLISNDLAPSVRALLNSKTGQVTNVESDGPYPGATQLGDHPNQGTNSAAKVPADGKTYDVWVQCAENATGQKIATGGGFRLAADAGNLAESKVQVVASEPTQIQGGKVVYQPITGDAAGSIVPNGWLVSAINNGTDPVIVRPWVICANVAK
jgi:hypothetical protein